MMAIGLTHPSGGPRTLRMLAGGYLVCVGVNARTNMQENSISLSQRAAKIMLFCAVSQETLIERKGESHDHRRRIPKDT